MTTEHDNDILNHIFNPLLPTGGLASDTNVEDSPDIEQDPEKTHQSKLFEAEGVQVAENGDVERSIVLFTKAIETAPFRASGYNNRAQSHRLLGDIAAAKMDLNNAINLSSGKGRSASQAYCQRGLIFLRENQVEEAKNDFECAAKLGSQFAKAQLVQLNPYAALCNKMLHDIMGKLQRGEHDEYESSNSTKNHKE